MTRAVAAVPFSSTRKTAAMDYFYASLRRARTMMVLNGLSFYALSLVSLFLAGLPGVLASILQLLTGVPKVISDGFTITIYTVSSMVALITAVVSFFYLRERYKTAKQVYYKLVQELLLYNTKTSVYSVNNRPEVTLFRRVCEIRKVPPPAQYAEEQGRIESEG